MFTSYKFHLVSDHQRRYKYYHITIPVQLPYHFSTTVCSEKVWVSFKRFSCNWCGSNWCSSNWCGSNWFGFNHCGSNWCGLNWFRPNWFALTWTFRKIICYDILAPFRYFAHSSLLTHRKMYHLNLQNSNTNN